MLSAIFLRAAGENAKETDDLGHDINKDAKRGNKSKVWLRKWREALH
jgi:hypothetical protein